MNYSLSKIDAATEQLDWAIRLFLDHEAFVPAITLAGAGEEIVGEIIGEQSVFARLKRKLSADFNLPEKVISQAYMNRARNWLKHWMKMKDAETISIDLEGEAIQGIVRALTNLILHDRSLPSEGPRFFEWLAANRQDLFECVDCDLLMRNTKLTLEQRLAAFDPVKNGGEVMSSGRVGAEEF